MTPQQKPQLSQPATATDNFRGNLQQNAALECGQHYYHYVGMMMAPLVMEQGVVSRHDYCMYLSTVIFKE